MRLVLLNPHIYLGVPVFNFIFRQRSTSKYSYFINQFIKSKDRPVAILFDNFSSFNQIGIKLPNLFIYLEVLLWMLINKLNPFKIKIYTKLDKLNPKEDVVYSFSKNNKNYNLSNFKGVVITHLTHYYIDTSELRRRTLCLKNNFFVCEGEMISNNFFQHYFPDIKFVYQLPFVFAKRFIRNKSFVGRINKCFATGTLTSPSKSCTDFFDFFGQGAFVHPMRKLIYDNMVSLNSAIDSSITYADDLEDVRKIKSNDSLKVKFIKKFLPYFLVYKFLPNYKNKYFKFNIVEKYNDYKMFLCPEEAAGVMPIGALEGMACGTALVASKDEMYDKLGMQDGIDYIAYKKYDLKDLVEKIKFYQLPENQAKLEKIAQNGYEFVVKSLNEQRVADLFWSDLEKLIKTFNNGMTEFKCSFQNNF